MRPQFDGRTIVESDGTTVWVNAASCLARFGRNGIDIHRPVSAQRDGQSECLFCTHTPSTPEDWELFRVKVKELHGVSVPARFKPRFLR